VACFRRDPLAVGSTDVAARGRGANDRMMPLVARYGGRRASLALIRLGAFLTLTT